MAGGCLATVGVVRGDAPEGTRGGGSGRRGASAVIAPRPPLRSAPPRLGGDHIPPPPGLRLSKRAEKPVDRHPELMVTQEAPDLSGCPEEAHSLGESSTSCQEVHNSSNMKKSEVPGVMAKTDIKPKSMHRAKIWSDDVENLYRFQQAGYRDEVEYKQVKQVDVVECWPETGFIKKLQRKDNTFYYYNRQRECEDKDVHKVKIYVY